MLIIRYLQICLLSVCIVNSQSVLSDWELISYHKYNKDFKSNNDLQKLVGNRFCQLSDIKGTLFLTYSDSLINLSKIGNLSNVKWVISSDINSEYIIIKNLDSIYIFKHDNFEKIKFLKKIDLKLTLRNIKIEGDRAFLFDAVYSSDNCEEKSQTIFIEIDLKTFKKRKINFDNLAGIELVNHNPRKLIDYSNNKIAIADLTNYKVEIFCSLEGRKLYQINRKPMEWIQISDSLPIYDCGKYLSTHLSVTQHFKYEVSQIWNLRFINDSTIIIAWSVPNKNENKFIIKYDIYQFNNNSWKIFKFDLNDYKLNENDVFSEYTIKIGNQYFIKNEFLYITKAFPLTNIKFGSLSVNQFDSLNENYYMEKELEYTCFIYKYNPK